MKIAVVTGASSGMGQDFARQITARESFDEIWLIARRKDRLEKLAATLPCPSRILAWDLTARTSFSQYETLLEENKPEIAVLVNAAGFGRFAHSTEVPLDDHLSMVELNIKATVSMITLSLPYMHKGSQIVNLGSLSSFQPVPYINVYGASKAFILSYSRALGVELKSRGIRVICVCPGWVQTEFFDHAVSENGAITYFNKIWRSEDVVKKALLDLERGKDLSILGFGVRFQVFLTKILPHKLVMSVWMKQQKHST